MKELTTTSYAILAHLAVRPFSPYELAQQFNRGLRLIWPRAESAIYEEPKNLVSHGLARVRKERAGKRTRSVYSITAKGRRALSAWLAQPSAPPAYESESHLRVMFGEHGAKDDMLQTLRQYEAFGREIRAQILRQLDEYLSDGGPFPDRLHVIALGSRYLLGEAMWMEEWARWARDQVASWPDTGAERAPEGTAVMRESLKLFGSPGSDG